MKYSWLLIILGGVVSAFAQRLPGEKPVPCTTHPTIKGKYKKLSMSLGTELQLYLKVDFKNRNDDNYMAIAQESLQRYCHEDELRIIFYKTKKHSLMTDLKDPESSPLAIFYFGKTREEIGLSVYAVVGEKVQVRRVGYQAK